MPAPNADAYYPLSTSVPPQPGQSDFLRWQKEWVSDGIYPNDLQALQVTPRGAGANLSVDMAPGRGVARAVFWEFGQTYNIPIAPNGGPGDRIDRLVIRLNATSPVVSYVLIQGDLTPQPPVPPVVQRILGPNSVPVVHDLYVVQILVRQGTSAIGAGDITDERQYLSGLGFRYWGVMASTPTFTVPEGRQLLIQVTGTTTITAIPARPAGTCILLEFLTQNGAVQHDGVNLNLTGTRNYLGEPGGTLTLVSTGLGWVEQSRTKERATAGLVMASPALTSGEVNLIRLGAAHMPTGIGDANLGSDVARGNLLTNPGFEVWQRGNGPFAANLVYTADRWLMSMGALSTYLADRDTTHMDTGSGACLHVQYSHQPGGNSQIQQKIENFQALMGRTVTFSVRVRGAVPGGVRVSITEGPTGTNGTSHTGGDVYQTLFVTHVVSPAAPPVTGVMVIIDLLAGGHYYFDNAVLAVSSVPVDYKPLHPSDDLARCQRYYEVMGGTGNGTLIIAGTALVGGALTTYETVGYNAPKMVVPTVTKNGVWTTQNTAVGAPVVNVWDANAVRLEATSTAVNGSFYAQTLAVGQNLTVETNPP